MLASIMIVHRSRIDRLDVLARSIFSSHAIFKREALITPSEAVVISRRNARGNAVPIVKIPLERMGTAFPLLSYMERTHRPIYFLKCILLSKKDVFLTLKYGKTRWRPGLRPGPRWGSVRRSPDPLGWGGDTPLETPPRSAPSALRFSRLRCSILGAEDSGVPIVVNLRNDH